MRGVMRQEEKEAKVKAEAQRVLNFLASMPALGKSSAVRDVVREVMLAQGALWDIKAKSLGAGIYQLSLKERRA